MSDEKKNTIIQHCPCGLFPHIESGFERSPYFPEAGKPLALGCRIENPAQPVLLSYRYDGKGQPAVHGTLNYDDERWTYYSFTIMTLSRPCHMEYSFAAHDGSHTQLYSAEIVSVTKMPASIASSPPLWWEIKQNDIAEVALFSNFTDKAYSKNSPLADESTPIANKNTPSTCELPYIIKDSNAKELARLDTDVKLWHDRHGNAVQAEFRLSVQGEAVYGFGEKFDRVNQIGLSPLSYVVEQFSDQQEKTYLPIPFFFTDAGAGFFMHGTWKTQFFTESEDSGRISVRILSECPKSGELMKFAVFSGTPMELIRKYTNIAGAPALPPQWVFGPWMSSNGWDTQLEAEEQIKKMEELDIPATVMVLEAWSDEETFYIWNDAQYVPKTDGSAFAYSDFAFPADGKWPDPKRFAGLLEEKGVKLLLWQIPVVKNAPKGAQLAEDIKYATENGLCLNLPDGTPYKIPEMWFGGSMIPDFSNPKTVRWWFDKRRYLIEELNVAGFKTDGGEFIFSRDAIFNNGKTAAEAHNDYPNMYIGAYHRFLDCAIGADNGVTFSRAGYSGAQRYPVHWAGDQVSTFSDLRGQLIAGLSLGLSGVPFWGFDIGGFAGDFPTTELYLRATAFAAFAPIMQFHSEPRYGQYYMTERKHWNNDRSPWNMAAANRDDRIIPIYRKFAKMRMHLLPYIWQEAQHCAGTSRPLMAHLIYDYHTDRRVINIEDEYMFGRDLLVAPIVEENATGRTVYLPDGEWFDFWTGEHTHGGTEHYRRCALDSILVYRKNKSQ